MHKEEDFKLLRTIFITVLVSVLSSTSMAHDTEENKLLKEIFRELVEIDTSHATGNTTLAIEAAAKRLRQAGFDEKDINLFEPFPGKGNLVVRLRGTGHQKPLLLVSHLDVVDATEKDWGRDPFKLIESDGYYYGRGVLDDKSTAAIYLSVLTQLKRQGYKPSRDIILALTSDEERHDVPSNGIAWLVKHHPDLLQAEFGLIQGGSGELRQGKPVLMRIGVNQKNYLSLIWEARNSGGHSSTPRSDNALYELASALLRLQAYTFPAHVSAIVRPYLTHSAPYTEGQQRIDLEQAGRDEIDDDLAKRLSTSPVFNALLRTTCVATRIQSDGPENALPQFVRATINCRLLPDDDIQSIEQSLRAIAGPNIDVQRLRSSDGARSSPIDSALYQSIVKTIHHAYPNVVSIPWMTTGATDARHLRAIGIPTYGFLGVFADPKKPWNAHGSNENIHIGQLFKARDIALDLILDITR